MMTLIQHLEALLKARDTAARKAAEARASLARKLDTREGQAVGDLEIELYDLPKFDLELRFVYGSTENRPYVIILRAGEELARVWVERTDTCVWVKAKVDKTPRLNTRIVADVTDRSICETDFSERLAKHLVSSL